MNVDEAIQSRRSVRAFLPDPVSRETVEALLALASRSASGSNIQPWKVHVVAGEPKRRLSRAILDSLDANGAEHHKREWNYYPVKWRDPYLTRRRKLGWDMYSLLGIGKGDFAATENQRRQNYDFFGAPVGMILTLDNDMEVGSFLDLGIFIGSLAIAARGRGLDSCAQAAFADFHQVIRAEMGIGEDQIVVCGFALGHADPDAAINRLSTVREPVAGFARFDGFELSS